MCRRNKTDVVAAFCLQFEHHFGESLVRRFVLFLLAPDLRDLIILAINAAQITVAEKDVASAVRSAQSGFFAEMRGVTGNNGKSPGITRGDFVFEAIVTAIFRANGAGFEQLFELFNSFSQLARRQ